MADVSIRQCAALLTMLAQVNFQILPPLIALNHKLYFFSTSLLILLFKLWKSRKSTRSEGLGGLEVLMCLACEQAFLFGQGKQASRERASEGPRKGVLAAISHKFSFPPTGGPSSVCEFNH